MKITKKMIEEAVRQANKKQWQTVRTSEIVSDVFIEILEFLSEVFLANCNRFLIIKYPLQAAVICIAIFTRRKFAGFIPPNT